MVRLSQLYYRKADFDKDLHRQQARESYQKNKMHYHRRASPWTKEERERCAQWKALSEDEQLLVLEQLRIQLMGK